MPSSPISPQKEKRTSSAAPRRPFDCFKDTPHKARRALFDFAGRSFDAGEDVVPNSSPRRNGGEQDNVLEHYYTLPNTPGEKTSLITRNNSPPRI